MSERLRIAICDDDRTALSMMTGAIRDTFISKGENPYIDSFSHAGALEKELRETYFDLIFLDIDMPGLDGIEFAKQLRMRRDNTDIIYVSSREDRVFESFQVHPFGFIRKSSFWKDVSAVVDLYLSSEKMIPKEQILFPVAGKNAVSISLRELLYIEGSKKHQLVYTTSRTEPYEIASSLDRLEEELHGKGFLRIHKGFLVNYRAIRYIDREEVTLVNDTCIPISRRKVQGIREEYLALMQQNEGAALIGET